MCEWMQNVVKTQQSSNSRAKRQSARNKTTTTGTPTTPSPISELPTPLATPLATPSSLNSSVGFSPGFQTPLASSVSGKSADKLGLYTPFAQDAKTPLAGASYAGPTNLFPTETRQPQSTSAASKSPASSKST